MNKTNVNSILMLLSAASLIGCGGSGGGSGGSGGDSITQWTGAAVTSSGTTILTEETTSGNKNNSTGAITVATNAGTFTSSGGPDGNGVYRDAQGNTAEPIQSDLISDTYQYVVPLVVTQNISGTQHVSTGVVGPATSANVMRAAATGGAVTYNGEAAIITDNTTNGTVRHRSANTVVTADFANNNVDVTMTGITAPAAGVSPTLDRVDVSGATISGSTFSGGTMSASLGGVDQIPTIAGTVSTNTTQGVFYGANGAGDAPAEVGGVALVEGTTGSISATFVAK